MNQKVLDKSYFEGNSAFLNVPYSFVYSDEYDVCFFFSSTVDDAGNIDFADSVT